MQNISTLKTQAKVLKQAIVSSGVELTYAQSLEIVAKQHGYANWDTLTGVVNKQVAVTRAPCLADMPCAPTIMWIDGVGDKTMAFWVSDYDKAALALIHDRDAFKAFFEHRRRAFLAL